MEAKREGEPKRPRRRVVLDVKIGADSWDEAIQALEQIATELCMRDHGPDNPVQVVSGSPSSGWNVTGDEDPTITHDSYFEAIAEWQKRNER